MTAPSLNDRIRAWLKERAPERFGFTAIADGLGLGGDDRMKAAWGVAEMVKGGLLGSEGARKARVYGYVREPVGRVKMSREEFLAKRREQERTRSRTAAEYQAERSAKAAAKRAEYRAGVDARKAERAARAAAQRQRRLAKKRDYSAAARAKVKATETPTQREARLARQRGYDDARRRRRGAPVRADLNAQRRANAAHDRALDTVQRMKAAKPAAQQPSVRKRVPPTVIPPTVIPRAFDLASPVPVVVVAETVAEWQARTGKRIEFLGDGEGIHESRRFRHIGRHA